MQQLRIGIIIGTTRQGRFADKPAQWILDLARKRSDMDAELVDLRDYPLPLFDEAKAPILQPPTNEVARRLSAKMAEFDGYLFITAEYNHGVSGALKNAIDHLYSEVARKPAAYVGYGGAGGVRAVEQLRLICIELRVAPLRDAVHIGRTEIMAVVQDGKSFSDFPPLVQSANTLFEQLAWWAATLKRGRENAA